MPRFAGFFLIIQNFHEKVNPYVSKNKREYWLWYDKNRPNTFFSKIFQVKPLSNLPNRDIVYHNTKKKRDML